MINYFKKMRRDQTNPATAVFTVTTLILAELSKTQEAIRTRSPKAVLARRTEALGFTNAYAVAEQEKFDNNVNFLRFMLGMWRDLGQNAILVKFDQFREILRRHDLMCVSFNAYKGDIPEQNLEEIEEAAILLATDGNSKYSKVLADEAKVASTSKQLIELIRFPYHYKGREGYFEAGKPAVVFDIAPETEGYMFIAAPKDFVEKPTVRMFESAQDRRNREEFETFTSLYKEQRKRYMDQVDRANQILKGIGDYANVKYSPKPAPLPVNYDPFVCTLCEYGVIIHSMWGPEAQDETIKRYEQLRDTIINNGLDFTRCSNL